MKMRFVLALVFSAFVSVLSAAAEKAPTAVDLLFKAKHLDTVKKGDALNYQFSRKTLNKKNALDDFEDDIVIDITNETPEKSKNVKLKVFTGDRARNPFETPGMTGNPILIWYLDRCVSTFNQFAGGSTAYLKGKFRTALGDHAKVEETKFEFEGKSVDGYKVKIVPFINDPAKNRMRGYEASEFEFLVSELVPGYFYGMTANYHSRGKGTRNLLEKINLKSVGETK